VPADGVVDPVALGVHRQVQDVVDLLEEKPLYFSVPNPRSRDPFWPGVRTRVRTWRSLGWVATKASNRDDRNGPPLSVTIVISGKTLPSASRS
jgi:hypothetical protein